MTALNDAVGKAINTAEAGKCEFCGGGKKIICIVTDGQENASKEV